MTWKLFETLLCKRHCHVAHNLVLRNLASHAHVDLTSAIHSSPTACGASTAGTNSIVSTTVTVHTDEVTSTNHVPFPSVLPASQKHFTENSDALAHGDSGLCATKSNDFHSLLSPSISDTVVDSLEVNAEATLTHEDKSQSETERTAVMDKAARDCVSTSSHVLSKSHSAFETQSPPSSLASHAVSQTLVDSREIPIQQVVYM